MSSFPGLFDSTCFCLDSQEVKPDTEILQQVTHGGLAWGEAREGWESRKGKRRKAGKDVVSEASASSWPCSVHCTTDAIPLRGLGHGTPTLISLPPQPTVDRKYGVGLVLPLRHPSVSIWRGDRCVPLAHLQRLDCPGDQPGTNGTWTDVSACLLLDIS